MDKLEMFKNERVVVHCDTKEKAKKFLKLLHNNGFKWQGGDNLLYFYNWDEYKEETCYCKSEYNGTRVKYSFKRWYAEHGYKVIEFEDFMGDNFKLSYLEPGHVIELKEGTKMLVIKHGDGLSGITSDCFLYLNSSYYNEDMKCLLIDTCTIEKVYVPKSVHGLDTMLKDENLYLIWERPEVKEYTMSQLREILGHEVKIIE